MAIKNRDLTVKLLVWDTVSNRGKTGDAGNITLYVARDDAPVAPVVGAVTEVSAANMPGVYKVTLTATEMDGDFICVSGTSSSQGVMVYPAFVQTERGDLDAILNRLDAVEEDLNDTLQPIATTISRLSEVLPLGAGVVLATKGDVEDAQTNPALIQRIIAVLPEPGEGVVVATEGDVTAAKEDIIGALPGDLSDLATKSDIAGVKSDTEKIVDVMPLPGAGVVVATKGNVADIKSDTEKVVAALPAGNVPLANANEIESVKNDTFAMRYEGVKLNIDGKTDVKAASAAALADMTLEELVALPGANPKLSQAIMLLYTALRYKTRNNEFTTTLFRSNDSVLATAELKDIDGVFTKEKFVSG